MKIVYYSINQKDMSSNDFQHATEKIRSVLRSPQGWKQYGYDFYQINNNEDPDTLTIDFMTNENLVKKYGYSINKLSAYVPSEHAVHLNIANWNGGSQSKLPVDRYRTYVINHEVGHALGLDHVECPIKFCQAKGLPECKGSIMQQMSKGPSHIAPCIENEWPLDPNIYHEFNNGKLMYNNVQYNDDDEDQNLSILKIVGGAFIGMLLLL